MLRGNMTNQENYSQENYRKKNTLLAKIVIGLILVAFMFTGIQSYLASGQKSPVVAEIGSIKIRQNQIEQTLKRYLSEIPANIDPSLVFTKKLIKKIIEDEINTTLLTLESEKLKLTVPEVVLRSVPDFQPQQIKQYLQRTNQSEKFFLRNVSSELVRNQLILALFSGVSLPQNLLKILSQTQLTKRDLSVFTLSKNDIKKPAAPSASQLKQYYEKNISQFEVPEQRTFNMLKIKNPDVNVTEQEIDEYYQNNIKQFTQSEQREVAVLSIPKDQAAPTKQELEKLSDKFITLGTISRTMVEEPTGSIVFELKENTFSEPVKNEDTQKIYWVKKIITSKNKKLKQVKKQIEKILTVEKINRQKKLRIQEIDDRIASGESFSEIAKKSPKYVTLVSSKDKTFAQLKGEFNIDKAVQIFRQNVGEDGQIYYDENKNAYAFEVIKINPKHAPSFEKIAKVVEENFLFEQQVKAIQQKAEEEAKAINSGKHQKFKSSARETIKKNNLSETGKKLALTSEQLILLSKLKADQAMSINTPSGAKVIVVKKIWLLEETPKEMNMLEDGINSFVNQNYLKSYLDYLQKKYNVVVKDEIISSIHEQFSSNINSV